MNPFFSALHTFRDRHDRLKNYVHNSFRVPLPKWGRFLMGTVYFATPVIGGWYIMQWAISKSKKSIGEYGEKLPEKDLQGFGNRRLDEQGQAQVVGSGGWGGGVQLATSDKETQQRNREMLNKFLKAEKRKYDAKTKRRKADTEHVVGDEQSSS